MFSTTLTNYLNNTTNIDENIRLYQYKDEIYVENKWRTYLLFFIPRFLSGKEYNVDTLMTANSGEFNFEKTLIGRKIDLWIYENKEDDCQILARIEHAKNLFQKMIFPNLHHNRNKVAVYFRDNHFEALPLELHNMVMNLLDPTALNNLRCANTNQNALVAEKAKQNMAKLVKSNISKMRDCPDLQRRIQDPYDYVNFFMHDNFFKNFTFDSNGNFVWVSDDKCTLKFRFDDKLAPKIKEAKSPYSKKFFKLYKDYFQSAPLKPSNLLKSIKQLKPIDLNLILKKPPSTLSKALNYLKTKIVKLLSKVDPCKFNVAPFSFEPQPVKPPSFNPDSIDPLIGAMNKTLEKLAVAAVKHGNANHYSRFEIENWFFRKDLFPIETLYNLSGINVV